MTKMLYQRIAGQLSAIANSERQNNLQWRDAHRRMLELLCQKYLPSGAGIDNGTKLDERSTAERLLLQTAFHHMNDVGMYDGWTDHTVTVTPSLQSGFALRITGRDRNDIKDYLHDVFNNALCWEVADEEIAKLWEDVR